VLDFDGTLVRSMEIHAEAYRRVLEPLGARVEPHEVFLREGARSETIIREFLERAGQQPTPDRVTQLAQAKQEVYHALGPPALYPGAEDLVANLRSHFHRLGLVTGTRRINLERLIPHLLPRLDAVLAQDAYQHDKPHPEPYEKAARALGLEPRVCAALENAVRGVKSARAAGYGFIVAVTTTMPAEALRAATADLTVPDLAAASEALAAWGKGRRPD
jgi:HAD superfamily hydrolase (TIGR01509 family)